MAGIHTLDLSHYPPENLHNEASFSSKNNGIVIIAYADFTNGQQYCHLAAPQVKAGALVRAVFAVGPAPGKTYDIYYNGASMVRANGMRFQPVETFSKALASIAELQALDLRIAANNKEIESLDRKSKAIDRVLDLAKDPDLNK